MNDKVKQITAFKTSDGRIHLNSVDADVWQDKLDAQARLEKIEHFFDQNWRLGMTRTEAVDILLQNRANLIKVLE